MSSFRSLRLALVCDWYPPRVGGIETHVRALAEQLTLAGHAVDVVTTAAGCRSDGVPAGRSGPANRPAPVVLPRGVDGVRVRRLRVPCVPHFAIATTPWLRSTLIDTLAEGEYDLVHAHASVLSPLAFAGVAAASRLGIPAVLTQHSVLGRLAPVCAAADQVLGWTRWRALFTAVSPLVADEIRDAAARAGRTMNVEVLPNGIHPRAWLVARRAPSTPGELRLASVMRLAPRKRPRALVAIAAAVRDGLPSGVRLRLRIAGDGPERGAVERDIRRFGLEDSVELLGWQPREAVRALYAASDAFVLPSILESFGIAALEARCAGLPVVAMRRAGLSGFIRDEVEGLLADDDAGMAAGILRLAADDRLRASVARHNRTTRPAETWDAVLARHEAVYAHARWMARGLSLHAASAPAGRRRLSRAASHRAAGR